MIKRLISGTEDTSCEILIDDDMVDIICTDGGLITHTESMTLKYFKETLGL
jgi:hypothetical protein